MPAEPVAPPPAPDEPPRRGAWGRLLTWVAAFEEAMDTSYDDIQDRRIAALERDVAALRGQIESDGAEGPRKV